MALKVQSLKTPEESYAELFGGNNKGNYEMIPPSELIEITDQPFNEYDEFALKQLAEDIKQVGQLSPCIVRLMADGSKVILAGRNRKRACELIGVDVKCEVNSYDDNTANLILCNSNLNQRQSLSYKEKAKAYALQKASLEALGHTKSTTAIAEMNNESSRTIRRYIQLAKLPDELLDIIDEGRMDMTAGCELSDIKDEKNFKPIMDFFLQDHKAKIKKIAAAEICEAENDSGYLDVPLIKRCIEAVKKEKPINIVFTLDELFDVLQDDDLYERDKGDVKESVLSILEQFTDVNKIPLDE